MTHRGNASKAVLSRQTNRKQRNHVIGDGWITDLKALFYVQDRMK